MAALFAISMGAGAFAAKPVKKARAAASSKRGSARTASASSASARTARRVSIESSAAGAAPAAVASKKTVATGSSSIPVSPQSSKEIENLKARLAELEQKYAALDAEKLRSSDDGNSIQLLTQKQNGALAIEKGSILGAMGDEITELQEELGY
ncbi:MAG: hypothetical protein LBO78_01550, partial [Rickettsiales bacterium]|nr:hypothetical protein [Rickettsiales bacterium]